MFYRWLMLRGGESTRFRKDRRRLFKVNEVEVVGKGVEPVGSVDERDVRYGGQGNDDSDLHNPNLSSPNNTNKKPFYAFKLEWLYENLNRKHRNSLKSNGGVDNDLNQSTSSDVDDPNNNHHRPSSPTPHPDTSPVILSHTSDVNLQKLRSSRARKLRRKQKMISGAKVAALGAGAITLGVLTSGLGIAAGMAFLGISGTIGGGTAVGVRKYNRRTTTLTGNDQNEEGEIDRNRSMSLEELDHDPDYGSGTETDDHYDDDEPIEHSDSLDSHPPDSPIQPPGKRRKKQRYSKGNHITIGSYDVNEVRRWRLAILKCTSYNNKRESGFFNGQGNVFDNDSDYHTLSENELPYSPNQFPPPVGSPRHKREKAVKNSRITNVERYMKESRWKLIEGGWSNMLGSGGNALRIYEEEPSTSKHGKRNSVSMAPTSKGQPCPPLKSMIVLNATPMNAFMCLMSNGRVNFTLEEEEANSFDPFSNSSTQSFNKCFSVIETIDEHSDIIHIFFRPLYLFPSWTTPRDFCLLRYWRLDDDGSYIICYDSISHPDCPPIPSHVRGELHGVFTIAPRKADPQGAQSQSPVMASFSNEGRTEIAECLLTHIVQVDPRGWVPTVSPKSTQGYAEAFGVEALNHILDIRDILDSDRFVNVSLDARGQFNRNTHDPAGSVYGSPSNSSDYMMSPDEPNFMSSDDDSNLSDFATPTKKKSGKSSSSNKDAGGSAEGEARTLENYPPPCATNFWKDVPPSNFSIRGKTYKKDKKKISAGSSAAFRMIALDLIETDSPMMKGMCGHPTQRIQQALQREKEGDKNTMPPFVVAVNIALPGPPFYHVVCYYAVDDITMIDGTNGTEFSKLAQPFFFGEDDGLRDTTFKLIPQIIEGNFIVRRAVGSTPAILGTKLKQTYARTDRYLELIVDVGSSSVAAGVVRLSIGYARTLVVDLAFVLQGDTEETLPEKVFGMARFIKLNFDDPDFPFVANY
ncbi:hypothetical protein TL16_g07565 [Triparma laevis f. inornata]|uniref:START domain-containing protein n=1 Tax=Triparma laevis f. inornata TaxID=1714386 RepID=A0A9W7EIA9_9STRA|nr:hypothetical protein TL16_g07565 [Triparma laevis f. inornata]